MEKALNVVSNNVTNAKTPGFARQNMNFIAMRFDPAGGLTGGVDAGQLISSRRAHLEQGVYAQSQRFGRFSQTSQSLSRVEPIFDISQQSGLAASIDRLFHSFSQLSVTPNDALARQGVIRSAQGVAFAFNQTTAALGDAAAQADGELRGSIDAINRVGQAIRNLNVELREDSRRLQDPGLDAQIHAALEQLSEFTDFTILRGEDGSFGVYLGGQTPLVIGDKFFPVSGDFSGDTPILRDLMGNDISGQIRQGRVRAFIDLRAGFLPQLQTDLDFLAQSLADRVTQTLLNGVDQNGQTPALDLFTYDSSIGAAATLAVNSIEPHELAAATVEAPGGNGNALNLAALSTGRLVNDFTFSQYYGRIAGHVGRSLSNARDDERAHALLLSQARTLRAETSEVSLDEEAAKLIAFQRAYQASAELVRVLNSLTEVMLGLIR